MPNLSNCTFKYVWFVVYQLYLNKSVKKFKKKDEVMILPHCQNILSELTSYE